jgi:hypothetical protein
LIEAQITTSPFNTIGIELVEPDGMPAIVEINWPMQSTVCEHSRFPEVAAAATKLFANAAMQLAAIKVKRKL